MGFRGSASRVTRGVKGSSFQGPLPRGVTSPLSLSLSLSLSRPLVTFSSVVTWTCGDSPPGAPLTLGHNKFAHLHHSHFLTRRLLGARGRVGAHAECVSVMWFRDVGGGPLFLGPARCSRSLVGSAHLGFASGSGAPTLQAVGHWRRRASLQAKAEVSSAHTIGTDTLT